MAGLTKRAVDAAKPKETEYFIWCESTPGFGLRVYPSGKKVFVSQVRVGRATRRVKIGAYGPYTVEQARRRAQEIHRAAAEGRDPQREKAENRSAITVAEMCDRYLEAARAGLVTTRFRRAKRPATIAIDEGRVSRHIKPLLGTLRARDATRSDVQRMADSIAQGKTAGVFKGKARGKAVVIGGPGTAARVVELLGGVYSWAEKRGLVAGPSPTKGTETARTEAKDRVLSASELTKLGKAIVAAQAKCPAAAAALRLIALTGWRREEACGLRWSEIDGAGHCVRLEGTKTGRSMRALGADALALLRTLSETMSSRAWVFPNRNDSGSADLKKSISAIFDAAGLTDARSHDLRRTFGSVAANEGYSDATIAELLGHARRGVTARHYIRRPDAALIAAADKVSATIAAALDARKATAELVPLHTHASPRS
ncbi:MAG TPA: integrase family protein [Xanthobacteraceae bacterium]